MQLEAFFYGDCNVFWWPCSSMHPLFSSKRALENKKLNKPCKRIDKSLARIHFVLVKLASFAFLICHILLRHNIYLVHCTRFVLVINLLIRLLYLLVVNTTFWDLYFAKKA